MEKCPYLFPDEDRTHRMEWRCEGVLHRDALQGPALVTAVGAWIIEQYFWNGVPHRVGGPAGRVWYRDSYQPMEEVYLFHGRLHRASSEGPANTEWEPDGSSIERYLFNGRVYRDPDEGPSQVWRDAMGEILKTRSSVRRDLTKEQASLDRLARRAGKLPDLKRPAPFKP